MGDIKTKVNEASVKDFINSVPLDKRRDDSLVLLEMFKKITGEQAKMWGTSMIGFGQYHYKSERSKQEGDWPLIAFSPRKQNLSLYIMPGFDKYGDLLKKLGKHKASVGCLYINKLEDINLKVLEELISLSFAEMKAKHEK
jgi:hypothetical protein